MNVGRVREDAPYDMIDRLYYKPEFAAQGSR